MKKENIRFSTKLGSQKLSSWEIKDLGEIYLFLLALRLKIKLWTRIFTSSHLKTLKANRNSRISTPLGSQKLSSWEIEDLGEICLFVIGPDPKNDALDLKMEVSGPKNKNISNQKLGLGSWANGLQ